MSDVRDILKDILGEDVDLTEFELDEGEGGSPPHPKPEPKLEPEPKPEPKLEPEPEVVTQLSNQEDEKALTAVSEDAEVIPLPTFTSDELMEVVDLRQFATLVTLTTRRWHAKAKDRRAAAEMAKSVGADRATYDAYKKLLVGQDDKLERVRQAIDGARTKHYEMTLPWSMEGANSNARRTGPRLLPNTSFFEYTSEMAQYKKEMDAALAEFIAAYPALVRTAQQKLGRAYVPEDYPPPDVLPQRFLLHFEFQPIPQGRDFSGLAEAQMEKLAETLERRNRQMLENAMHDAWLRLRELVELAADRFGSPDRQFHYTLPQKLKAAAKSFKSFNLVGDSCMEQARYMVEKELSAYDASQIREDDALRARLGTKALEVLALMDNYVESSHG